MGNQYRLAVIHQSTFEPWKGKNAGLASIKGKALEKGTIYWTSSGFTGDTGQAKACNEAS